MSAAAVYPQGRVEGTVANGTTKRPVAGLEVRLLQPRQGMQQVGVIKTDAEGRFVFATGIDPGAFYLLQAEFQGVHYPVAVQFEPSGTASVNLAVYETTKSDSNLKIQALRMLVRAEGTKVRVQEEYLVENASDPPRAYVNSSGTFRFRLSPGAGEPTVAVTGLMNMALPQSAASGKAPGEFFIRYPMKPGVTTVSVAYETDYSANNLPLSESNPFPIDLVELYVSPSNLTVTSPVLKPAGLDPTSDVQKLEARNLPRDALIDFRVAGEAAPSAQSEIGPTGAEIKSGPNSMSRLGVHLLVCFLLVLLWALGVRVAKEWPQWMERRGQSPVQKQLAAEVDDLLNSLADLDELFASRKIPEKKYWKERLELKARLVAILKKAPPSLLESYATRNAAQ